eukprot:1152025-Pelagomonas_calceolata.AAC.1
MLKGTFLELLNANTLESEVMCFDSRSDNLPPLYFDGTQLPYTDTFKYLGMVRDKTNNLDVAADAALRPLTAGARPCQQITRPDLAPQDVCNPFWHVCKSELGYPVPLTRQRDGQSHAEVAANSA